MVFELVFWVLDHFAAVTTWIVLAVAVAAYGQRQGHNVGFVLPLALFCSPLVVGIFLLAIGPDGQTCVRCRETIRRDAVACRFCGAPVVAPVAPQGPAPVAAPPAVAPRSIGRIGQGAALAVGFALTVGAVSAAVCMAYDDDASARRPAAKPAPKKR